MFLRIFREHLFITGSVMLCVTLEKVITFKIQVTSKIIYKSNEGKIYIFEHSYAVFFHPIHFPLLQAD